MLRAFQILTIESLITSCVLVLVCSLCHADQATSKEDQPPWRMFGTAPGAAQVERLRQALEKGCQTVTTFFGKPFAQPFQVEVFSDRAQFDEYFKKRWQLPKTQPWMVASGVADRLTVLSTDVWKTQAAEHDPDDLVQYQQLIAHELVHVYHGQRNPTKDFEGMDDLGWLVEGLAVYASGQLDGKHHDAGLRALQEGQGPKTLATAWSGKYRYGVCGSLVGFIDKKWGRATLISCLPATKPGEVLNILKTTEKEFLSRWAADTFPK